MKLETGETITYDDGNEETVWSVDELNWLSDDSFDSELRMDENELVCWDVFVGLKLAREVW